MDKNSNEFRKIVPAQRHEKIHVILNNIILLLKPQGRKAELQLSNIVFQVYSRPSRR